MTVPEKGYFMKFAKRHISDKDNNYLKLFDAINKQEDNYNESEIKRQFRNEKFVKQFTAAKNYLYNMILKSLVSFNDDKSTDSQITNLRDQYIILFQKTLFDQSEQILNRAKKKALEEERFSKLSDIIRDQKNFDYRKINEPGFDKYVDSMFEQELDVLEKQKNVAEYYALYLKMSSLFKRRGVSRNNAEAEAFKKIVRHPLMKSDSLATSVRSKNLYYIVNYLFFYGINDHKNAFRNTISRLELIEKNPEKVAGGIKEHLYALSDAIAMSYNLRDFKRCISYLRKQREISDQHRMSGTSPNFTEMYFKSYNFELNIYIISGFFKEGLSVVNEVTDWLHQYEGRINKSEELKVIYSIAYLYFGAGEKEKSLKWLNRILSDKSESRQDYKAFARILNMIIHYELGNYDNLEYEYQSAKRFLKKSDRLYKIESLILKSVCKLPGFAERKALIEHLELFEYELRNVYKKENFGNASEYFDIFSWIESLSGKVSFSDSVRAKSKIKLSDILVV